MKRLITVLLALSLCVGLLAACGNKETPVTGTTYDTGDMTLLVPKGWTAVPVKDPVTDENDPTDIYICKGTGENLRNTAPYVRVSYYPADEHMGTPNADRYENGQDLEPQSIGSTTWNGISADNESEKIAVLWTQTEDHKLKAELKLRAESGSLELKDREVQAILASIVPTGKASQLALDEKPEVIVPEQGTEVFLGDWAGILAPMECTGNFVNLNIGASVCIARFTTDDQGNLACYFGTSGDAGPLQMWVSLVPDDFVGLYVQGTWKEYSIDECYMAVGNGTLNTSFYVADENGDTAMLALSLRRIGDSSWTNEDPKPTAEMLSQLNGKTFEQLASDLGCTGYPAN